MYSENNKFGFGYKPKIVKNFKKNTNHGLTIENDNKKYFERGDLCDRQWAIIQKELLQFSSTLFEQYVEKLYGFIDSHIAEFSENEARQRLIPTAIIALNSKTTQKRIANEIDSLMTSKDSLIKTIHLDSFQATNKNTLFQVFFSNLRSDSDIELADLKSFSFGKIMSMWIDEHSNQRPSLAIFFHDFENFNKEVLSTLVSILKEYTEQISIVFVFMIYNQINSSLEYVLPAQVSDCLLIEDITPFYEPKLLPHIFKEFITNPKIKFKIHPLLVKQIDSFFSNYEFSFENFLYFIKTIVIDHFFESPLSTIYELESMNSEHEDIFRNTLNIQFDDDKYQKSVHDSYVSLLKKHEVFSLNIEIIATFKKYCLLDETQRFVTLYSDILNNELDFKNYFYPLLKVKETQFQAAISKILKEFHDFKDNPILSKIINFRHDLENMIAKESEENQKQETMVKKLNLDCDGTVELQRTKLRGLNARLEFRRSLMTSIQNSQKLSPFEKLKCELVQDLIVEYEKHPLVDQKEMIDGLFYRNADFINSLHNVSMRERFDSAYSLKYEADNAPDSLVLYRLYKEAGRVFNLYDMYLQFCNERNFDMEENESLVHFSNALADFEFIGLVQPSRKADFMNKTLWL